MDREKASYIEGTVSIFINIGLFFIKLWAGIVSGSIALSADAWHSLSDTISSVVVIVGAKLSSKKPDIKHPFGHGRWEQIASIFIGFLLGIIAYDFIKDSIIQFQSKESANFGTLALVVTIISILANEGLAQYAFYLGKKTDTLTIKADGWHHRTDALSSIIILIGIAFKNYFWWIDSVLGIIVSIMIFYVAYEIIKESINKLLGEEPSSELIKKIKTIVESLFPDDLSPHHFHIHNYVTHKELTFHIKLDNNLNIEQGHSIATEIENELFKELKITSTIHVEPRNLNQ
ncbi:MAG: cation transporter [Bacteroidales bacterium]|nr:cation transporter [Bacteroidales bacterium]